MEKERWRRGNTKKMRRKRKGTEEKRREKTGKIRRKKEEEKKEKERERNGFVVSPPVRHSVCSLGYTVFYCIISKALLS